MMSSKTGDLLLELEAETGVVRDQWVSAVNPQKASWMAPSLHDLNRFLHRMQISQKPPMRQYRALNTSCVVIAYNKRKGLHDESTPGLQNTAYSFRAGGHGFTLHCIARHVMV